MSKGANRNKKTPMFVSNINSNYQFVDYTQPGQTPTSAFGNPNPNLLSVGNAANQSPKKQENNWFQQMLVTQQTNSNSPVKAKVEESRPDKVDQGFSFEYSQNTVYSANVRSQVAPQVGNFKKTQQIKYEKSPFQKNYQKTQPITSTTSGQQKWQPQKQKLQPSMEYQPQPSPFQKAQQFKKYEFSQKTEFSYPSYQKENPSYGTSSGSPLKNQYGYSETPTARVEKVKTEPSYGSSSGSGIGFTNQDLVNSLPEPARSNILAIIRRSKGICA